MCVAAKKVSIASAAVCISKDYVCMSSQAVRLLTKEMRNRPDFISCIHRYITDIQLKYLAIGLEAGQIAALCGISLCKE